MATQEQNELEQRELAAVRESAGYTAVTDRAFLRVTGSDATRWLNGMVSNSIQALEPGEGNYNFLLNAQGRIQGDATVYRESSDEPAEFLLATTAGQVETLREHLDHFIIMDDVELTSAYADEAGLLIVGKEAGAALERLGLPAIEPLRMAHADTEHGPVLLLTPVEGLVPAFELRGAVATIDGLRDALVVPEIGGAALESLRLLEGRPVYGQDIRDRDLPQETSQTHALHFAKGCYLGQEIVERIRSRGQVHRRFMAFRLTGELPAALPAALEAGGKPAGEITSAGVVPLADGSALIALGYARQEVLDAKQELSYPGGVAIPYRDPTPAG
ncbi:MAG: folate-binding protein [Acidobacteriaceae bacterium]